MAHYDKGAKAERELLQRFFEKGFAVARTAGSGVSHYPAPDLFACKNTQRFALECKAWKGAYLNVPIKKMEELQHWSKKASAEFVIAWKVPRKNWLFLSLEQFRKNKKHYSISLTEAHKKGKNLLTLIGEQTQLKTKV
jgi:Holliday junction resolvase